MTHSSWGRTRTMAMAALALGCTALTAIAALPAHAAVEGVSGKDFNLVAEPGSIDLADGAVVYMWGFGAGPVWTTPTAKPAQLPQMYYPGPTLIVNQGDTVTVTLTNTLDEPVSIVFPGQTGVTATATAGFNSAPGQLTLEASAPSSKKAGAVTTTTYGQVKYSFVADHPGTFHYHSGSHQDLQVEMGLAGTLIVRPAGGGCPAGKTCAYNHPATAYDREYLFVETEIDPLIHEAVAASTSVPKSAVVDMSKRFANYWFLNGRNGPDTMQDAGVPWLPSQPYNALPQMHPGEKILLRVVGGGLDVHPFHHHGNHARMIGRDGMLSQSAPGSGPDVAEMNFTIQTAPGETYDAIFEWTGLGLNWDYAGRKTCTVAELTANPDCGKPFPVKYPNPITLAAGPHYSGSPYLGQLAQLPTGEGGFNVNGGNYFMWHSHTEKELTNYNVYPGGMMTFMIIQPPTATIVE